MKESFWGYWIIVLGIFVIIIMMLISSVTTTNTQDYYMIKDVTEAAMVDAVDYSYYRQYQELRINREKFVENFLRRFAENVSLNTYTIDFYDLYEAPPKVSVKVTTNSGTFSVMGDSTSFDIVNKVDAVLENSGTVGSSGKDNNSNISVPEDVVTGDKDNNYEGIPSTGNDLTPPIVNPGDDSIVPSSSDIGSVVATSWYQSKYVDCRLSSVTGKCKGTMKVKSKYLSNPSLFRNELLKDWQNYNHVTFNSEEKEQFLIRVGLAFPWASDGSGV